MKLSEYILRPQDERMAHIDLATPCDLSCKSHEARRKVDQWHGLENDIANWKEARIQCCHLCKHHSRNGWCANPLHVYIGTTSENHLDMEQEVRSRMAAAAGKKSAELGVGVHAPENLGKGARATNAQRWMSTVDGFISHSGGVGRHHRRIGQAKDKKIEINHWTELMLEPLSSKQRIDWMEKRKD